MRCGSSVIYRETRESRHVVLSGIMIHPDYILSRILPVISEILLGENATHKCRSLVEGSGDRTDLITSVLPLHILAPHDTESRQLSLHHEHLYVTYSGSCEARRELLELKPAT